MIVRDEQLLSYGIQAAIARWYRGTVTDITQLRPHTVILDDAIPMLLRAASRPTFVAINVADFWRCVAPNPRFCLVCCTVPHTRAQDIPELLRRVLALEPFRTRSRRLGTIVRVSLPVRWHGTLTGRCRVSACAHPQPMSVKPWWTAHCTTSSLCVSVTSACDPPAWRHLLVACSSEASAHHAHLSCLRPTMGLCSVVCPHAFPSVHTRCLASRSQTHRYGTRTCARRGCGCHTPRSPCVLKRIGRQRAIPAIRRGVAGKLVPRGKDGTALQITDGRLRILTVEREPRDAPRQARRHEQQEHQTHAWLRGLHEPRRGCGSPPACGARHAGGGATHPGTHLLCTHTRVQHSISDRANPEGSTGGENPGCCMA